jgi:hypothetical protein
LFVGDASEQLLYSWSRIGADMPTGAQFMDYNRVVLINNVQLAHSGTYRCTVSRLRGTGTYGDVSIAIEGEYCSSCVIRRGADFL